jgi:Trk-type K+ transport system membrane component
MVIPLLVGLYYRDQSVIPLLKSIGITAIAGICIYFIFRSEKVEVISQREGMAIVAVGWTAVGLFGALPSANRSATSAHRILTCSLVSFRIRENSSALRISLVMRKKWCPITAMLTAAGKLRILKTRARRRYQR